VALYLPRLDPASGGLAGLSILPLRLRRMRLERAPAEDARWLAATLDRESRPFGCRVRPDANGALAVRWAGG
jgi:poly-gamma-glutamate synthesis protein (capsule biosynthesis protein)